MTAQWREIVNCSNCGSATSSEQPWKQWIRSHQDLDSRKQCLCLGDSDLWVQRYGTRLDRRRIDRDVMHLMMVEVKTHNAELDASSTDRLRIINDLLRTNTWRDHRERDNGRFIDGHDQNTRIVASYIAGRKVRVICYGVHLLRISGQTFPASQVIAWDGKKISCEDLLKLLRYELHPDSLLPMEHRAHKRRFVDQPALWSIADLKELSL